VHKLKISFFVMNVHLYGKDTLRNAPLIMEAERDNETLDINSILTRLNARYDLTEAFISDNMTWFIKRSSGTEENSRNISVRLTSLGYRKQNFQRSKFSETRVGLSEVVNWVNLLNLNYFYLKLIFSATTPHNNIASTG
jgi:hypothetical protein